jgi:glucose-1-phosphate cytidylyltransferase
MKVAILAGGAGTRMPGEMDWKPKPMLEIGGKPVLWHIMMHYTHHGFEDFVIALGAGGEMIKKYVIDYARLQGDVTVRVRSGEVVLDDHYVSNWVVRLVDTGIATLTGGRLKRLAPHLGDETFLMAWGDCVSDVDLGALLAFHRSHGKLATVTAVRPPARYGYLVLEGDRVAVFAEKPQAREGWINGAFFVLEPGVLDYIDGDDTQWEAEPLQRLVRDGQLMAYRHEGFWQCLDTLRERHILEQYWQAGNAPWKTWE